MAKVTIDGLSGGFDGTASKVEVREGGTLVSSGIMTLTESAFFNAMIPTALAGGVSTPPEHRRHGYVREMFETIHRTAAESGAAVSLLHPFSFPFYRKFGYEKVSDHLILRFPSEKIDFVPYECDFVPCLEDRLQDLISVYESFARGRGLLLKRYAFNRFMGENKYICYIGGKPSAYIGYDTSSRIDVNRIADSVLYVREFAFVSPEALLKLFSFLRVLQGEFETIEFSNAAMAPEVDMVLKAYHHTAYRIVPDIMARPLNTLKLLTANTYPREEGRFTVKINDTLPTVAGCFTVEFGGGDVSIKENVREPDIVLSPGIFARLVYGYDGATELNAGYLEGVELTGLGGAGDFFRAFPRRPSGVFEHF